MPANSVISERPPEGGTGTKVVQNTGLSPWVPVPPTGAGVDLSVDATGSATVEATSALWSDCTDNNPIIVATAWDRGVQGASAKASSEVTKATAVRLNVTAGFATMWVRV